MNPYFQELSAKLKASEIRPSFQRVKVLDFLIKNPCHPTVDMIFQKLNREIPTLSKTTIYNTLNLFQNAGLVRALTIEDNETRYDIITENHGHFKCEECGFIFNFNIDVDLLSTDDLANFKIIGRNVYFKGICPQCLKKI